jgi:hypothetical protein
MVERVEHKEKEKRRQAEKERKRKLFCSLICFSQPVQSRLGVKSLTKTKSFLSTHVPRVYLTVNVRPCGFKPVISVPPQQPN